MLYSKANSLVFIAAKMFDRQKKHFYIKINCFASILSRWKMATAFRGRSL